MGREEFELLKGGVVKRRVKRRVGIFIDGTGLDRATRRLVKKVDLSSLVSGLSQGLEPEIARYYTLVPYEDDARQFAFLDAVERAGLEVVTKRLPPKGVKRQVSMDVHMATDLISFSMGVFGQPKVSLQEQEEAEKTGTNDSKPVPVKTTKTDSDVKRVAVVVCPVENLATPFTLATNLAWRLH